MQFFAACRPSVIWKGGRLLFFRNFFLQFLEKRLVKDDICM